MPSTLKNLTIDLQGITLTGLFDTWNWLLTDMETLYAISCLGDAFFIGKDKGVHWLQCDCGTLSKIAENEMQFLESLEDEAFMDNLFLPELVNQLKQAGKTLKENQVYSYQLLPLLGGEYAVDNIEPTNLKVHFELTGIICEQVNDLPEGTVVEVVVKP